VQLLEGVHVDEVALRQHLLARLRFTNMKTELYQTSTPLTAA
jgi:hypothetical protein